jgi:hypothetical protein
MILVKVSKYVSGLAKNHIENLINRCDIPIFKDRDVTISIAPNRWAEDEGADKPFFSCYILEDQVNRISSESDCVDEGIADVFSKFLKQENCSHSFKRSVLNNEGEIDPTGTGVCAECNKISEAVFEIDATKRLVRGDFSDKRYISKFQWESDTFLQCGSSGIVLARNSSDPYQTAFFEAFPEVDGYGLFIRGEGKLLFEAEESAWNKYIKYSRCGNHEFSRMQGGVERQDGFGTCTNCKMSTSGALPPLTVCTVCSLPTKNTENEVLICKKDHIAKNIELVLKEKTDYVISSKILSPRQYSFLSVESAIPRAYISHIFSKKIYDSINDEAIFNKKYSLLNQISNNYLNALRRYTFGLKTNISSKEYPNVDDPVFIECVEFASSKILDFFNSVDSGGEYSLKDLVKTTNYE